MRGGSQSRAVTYEAADKHASCALGCYATACFALGIGMGLWYLSGGIWKAIVAVLGLLSGIGLVLFLRSPARGKWEVTLDPDERVIRLLTRVRGVESLRAISYDDVSHIELEEIERETSDGESATFRRPVIYLTGGREPVRFDERLSVRSAARAQEVLEQMRRLME